MRKKYTFGMDPRTGLNIVTEWIRASGKTMDEVQDTLQDPAYDPRVADKLESFKFDPDTPTRRRRDYLTTDDIHQVFDAIGIPREMLGRTNFEPRSIAINGYTLETGHAGYWKSDLYNALLSEGDNVLDACRVAQERFGMKVAGFSLRIDRDGQTQTPEDIYGLRLYTPDKASFDKVVKARNKSSFMRADEPWSNADSFHNILELRYDGDIQKMADALYDMPADAAEFVGRCAGGQQPTREPYDIAAIEKTFGKDIGKVSKAIAKESPDDPRLLLSVNRICVRNPETQGFALIDPKKTTLLRPQTIERMVELASRDDTDTDYACDYEKGRITIDTAHPVAVARNISGLLPKNLAEPRIVSWGNERENLRQEGPEPKEDEKTSEANAQATAPDVERTQDDDPATLRRTEARAASLGAYLELYQDKMLDAYRPRGLDDTAVLRTLDAVCDFVDGKSKSLDEEALDDFCRMANRLPKKLAFSANERVSHVEVVSPSANGHAQTTSRIGDPGGMRVIDALSSFEGTDSCVRPLRLRREAGVSDLIIEQVRDADTIRESVRGMLREGDVSLSTASLAKLEYATASVDEPAYARLKNIVHAMRQNDEGTEIPLEADFDALSAQSVVDIALGYRQPTSTTSLEEARGMVVQSLVDYETSLADPSEGKTAIQDFIDTFDGHRKTIVTDGMPPIDVPDDIELYDLPVPVIEFEGALFVRGEDGIAAAPLYDADLDVSAAKNKLAAMLREYDVSVTASGEVEMHQIADEGVRDANDRYAGRASRRGRDRAEIDFDAIMPQRRDYESSGESASPRKGHYRHGGWAKQHFNRYNMDCAVVYRQGTTVLGGDTSRRREPLAVSDVIIPNADREHSASEGLVALVRSAQIDGFEGRQRVAKEHPELNIRVPKTLEDYKVLVRDGAPGTVTPDDNKNLTFLRSAGMNVTPNREDEFFDVT